MKLLLLLIMISHHVISSEFLTTDAKVLLSEISGHASFGDLNGDGYNDIFTSEFYSLDSNGCRPFVFCNPATIINEPAKIYINNQAGGFYLSEQAFTPTDLEVEEIGWLDELKFYRTTIADINNDGNNDIVASDGQIFINNGHAEFINQINVDIGSGRESIKTIDFDNDGILEIFNEGKIRSRTNIDPLTYQTNHQFSIDISQKTLFADFNNDEFIDILAYGDESVVTVYLNNQLGEFSNSSKVLLNVFEDKLLVAGDVNLDSKIDIIFSDNSILQNQGNMEFTKIENSTMFDSESSTYNFENYEYTPIKLTKYNEDEHPDLIVKASEFGIFGNYYVLFNDGNGKFGTTNTLASRPIADVYLSGTALIEDFNNDGYDDYVVSNNYGVVTLDNSTNKFSDPIDSIYAGFAKLHINNPLSSYKNNNKVNYSYLPFDINGDGQDEFLSVYSYTQFQNLINVPHISGLNLISYFNGYQPHYLSNTTADGFDVKTFDLFEEDLINYLSFIKGDLNNDGLEDLLVNYTDCENQCGSPKSRIFYNSSSGLKAENTRDINIGYIDNASIVDFDGNSTNEIVRIFNEGEHPNIVTKIQIIELFSIQNEVVFHEINITGLGSEFSINDLNNDEIVDLVFLNTNKIPSVIYGNNSITSIGNQIELVNHGVNDYRIIDFDGDDDLDLFINTEDLNTLIRYENVDNGIFINSTNFFFPEDARLNLMTIADFTGDGDMEVLYFSDSYPVGFNIYKYERSRYELLYTYNSSEYYHDYSFSLVDDIDKDGHTEIIYDEKIFYSREFKFLTGLIYDPNHSGHGFSVENVGNDQFFSVFYTYDNDSFPEWYTNLGLFEVPREDYWNIASIGNGLIRSEYDYSNQQINQNSNDEYRGSIAHRKCSNLHGDISLDFEIGINAFALPISQGDWCSQPIVGHYQRPIKNDLSGLWWAGSDDSGWGWSVSLVERIDTTDIVVVLYYYDGEGNPRWLIGQQSGFEPGVEITLDMNMVKGYPRWSLPQALELESAGTMSLTLNQASRDLNLAGSLSVDVNYPGPEGGNWVRNNVPIALFSVPRNK